MNFGTNSWYDSGTKAPGETMEHDFYVTSPSPGTFTLRFRMVRDGTAWFGDYYSAPFIIVSAAPASNRKGMRFGRFL